MIELTSNFTSSVRPTTFANQLLSQLVDLSPVQKKAIILLVMNEVGAATGLDNCLPLADSAKSTEPEARMKRDLPVADNPLQRYGWFQEPK